MVARKAAQALQGAASDLYAQLIFVARDDAPGFADAFEGNGSELITAPAGSSRAEMCDLGMRRARGSIVAVRDDEAVGNAQWLDAYRSVLPRREIATSKPVVAETVVMDTLIANRVGLADSVIAVSAETKGPTVAIEMAAAV